jgi:hypothetical protein
VPKAFFELLVGRSSLDVPLPQGLSEGPAPQVILCDGRLRLDLDSHDLLVEGQVDVAFAGFPYLGTLLPSEETPLCATVQFAAASGLTLKVEPGSTLELGLDLPTLDAGNKQIALGRITGRIGGVGLKLPRSLQPTLDVVFSVKLPAGLNQILGGYEIFETEKPVSATVSLGVVADNLGASVTLADALAKAPSQVTSPLKAIAQPLTWDGTDVSGRLDLGGAGAIRVRVPRLAFGDGAFVAHGGFELDADSPPRLPLWPLKSALGHLIGAAADGLPDYLPLQDLSVLDEHDRLNVAKLVDALNALIPQGKEGWLPGVTAKLKGVLEDAAKASDSFARHLPERLKAYLRASPFRPGLKFDLDIEASPAGSLDVRIACEPPLRLLVPTPSMLLGLELGEFSLGPILGGTLLKLRVDARIDSFDLISLALLLPVATAGDKAASLEAWLPDLSRMQNTLIASELLALVEYESAGIPIPIPLLAKDLGFRFVGVGGLEMAAGVSCHLQRDGIADILETVRKLFRFITTDYLLTQDDGPGLQLMVGVDATYLQLPKLVGEQVFGSKTPLVPERDAVAYAFQLLNALKRFSLAELICGIPLSHRVKTFDITLGPAEVHGSAAVTTTDELRAGFARSDIEPNDPLCLLSQDKAGAERLIGLILAATAPVSGEPQRSGAVVLAAGECRFGGALSLEAQSAAALIGASAFAAAFRLRERAAIAGLSLDLSGCAQFDLEHLREEGAIGVAGRAVLKLGEHVVCEGGIALSGAGIAFSGDFDVGTALVPHLQDLLHVSGGFNASFSKTGFHLRLDAAQNARLSLLGVSGAAQQFALTAAGLVARLTEQLPNVGSCELVLRIADFRNAATYGITGSISGQFSASATVAALNGLRNAYRRSLSDAHAALDREIANTSYWHPVALAELEAQQAVIQALQTGAAWSPAIETAISYVVGRYATTVVNIATLLTPAGLALAVLGRLGVFGRLAQWSPAQWAACVTVTELRLAATAGKPAVVFDAYGTWWGGSRPEKLVEVPADMPVLRPEKIIEQLAAGIVKWLLARP